MPLQAKPETYSTIEIREILQSLTEAQKTRLFMIARLLGKRIRYSERDLIQEAYARVLDGKRAWPKNVAVVPFLAGVMRSIAWDWRIEDDHEDIDVDSLGSEHHAAEAKLNAQKLFDLFSDDPIAQKILAAIIKGARGKELQRESGLSDTDYESKRTKIRRRLEKAWFKEPE